MGWSDTLTDARGNEMDNDVSYEGSNDRDEVLQGDKRDVERGDSSTKTAVAPNPISEVVSPKATPVVTPRGETMASNISRLPDSGGRSHGGGPLEAASFPNELKPEGKRKGRSKEQGTTSDSGTFATSSSRKSTRNRVGGKKTGNLGVLSVEDAAVGDNDEAKGRRKRTRSGTAASVAQDDDGSSASVEEGNDEEKKKTNAPPAKLARRDPDTTIKQQQRQDQPVTAAVSGAKEDGYGLEEEDKEQDDDFEFPSIVDADPDDDE